MASGTQYLWLRDKNISEKVFPATKRSGLRWSQCVRTLSGREDGGRVMEAGERKIKIESERGRRNVKTKPTYY